MLIHARRFSIAVLVALVALSAMSALSATSVLAQSPSSTLAPTGTLRGVFLGSNPVQGRVNQATGEVTGPVPDL
ncbi:MAG TPA: hypothetical protein VKB36_02850, partial [Vicinamibacterales bacterium]|nr:hypothetical protein [Vicinamibacterales bacterium]